MYYVLSGVLAMLVSLKYTKHMADKQTLKCAECCEKIELLEKRICLQSLHLGNEIEKRNSEIDKELLQKVMTTVLPIAKAVNKLNNQVGIQ